MNQNLIISENNPELINLLMGDELYVVDEPKWYDEIASEGGNKYRFLNIVSHSGSEIIPSEQKDFFFRMINAIQTDRIKMDADGFAVVNAGNYKGLKWNNLEKIFSPKYCIIWGVDPHSLDLNVKLNGGALVNECRIVYVNSMETIFSHEPLKRQLWTFVKRMFGMEKK